MTASDLARSYGETVVSALDVESLERRAIEDVFDDSGQLYIDLYFSEHASEYLFVYARECQSLHWDDVPEIARLMDADAVSQAEYDLMADACTLVRGFDRASGRTTYFAPIAAPTISNETVQRAIEAAEMLGRFVLNARPVVCGYETRSDAATTIEAVDAIVLTRQRPR